MIAQSYADQGSQLPSHDFAMVGTQEAPRFSDHVDLDNLQRCGNVMAGKDGADGPEGLKLKIEGDSERFCQADLLLSGAQPHSRSCCLSLPLYFGHDKAPESDLMWQ